MDYQGVLIEESLSNPKILKGLNISSTKVEQVTKKHKTPWLKQWTLHTIKVPANKMEEVAKAISNVLEASYWYADFKSN